MIPIKLLKKKRGDKYREDTPFLNIVRKCSIFYTDLSVSAEGSNASLGNSNF